jgi:hypothetical protein
MTQVPPSETREPRSDIEEKLHQLSSIPRDIRRQLIAKTLRLLQRRSETFEESANDRENIASTPEQSVEGAPQETKPGWNAAGRLTS